MKRPIRPGRPPMSPTPKFATTLGIPSSFKTKGDLLKALEKVPEGATDIHVPVDDWDDAEIGYTYERSAEELELAQKEYELACLRYAEATDLYGIQMAEYAQHMLATGRAHEL